MNIIIAITGEPYAGRRSMAKYVGENFKEQTLSQGTVTEKPLRLSNMTEKLMQI
jgi:hypothetical protein